MVLVNIVQEHTNMEAMHAGWKIIFQPWSDRNTCRGAAFFCIMFIFPSLFEHDFHFCVRWGERTINVSISTFTPKNWTENLFCTPTNLPSGMKPCSQRHVHSSVSIRRPQRGTRSTTQETDAQIRMEAQGQDHMVLLFGVNHYVAWAVVCLYVLSVVKAWCLNHVRKTKLSGIFAGILWLVICWLILFPNPSFNFQFSNLTWPLKGWIRQNHPWVVMTHPSPATQHSFFMGKNHSILFHEEDRIETADSTPSL